MGIRLRVHPLERFAPREHLIDLSKTITALQQEAYPVLHGHRQIAVFKYGPATLLVYDFEQGGDLGTEVADGVVTISVMGGALAVRTPERLYDLSAGMIVVLTPGVAYRIVAHQPSQLLLTVHLEQAYQYAGRDEVGATRSSEGKELRAQRATGMPGAVRPPAEVAVVGGAPRPAPLVCRAIMRCDARMTLQSKCVPI